MSKANEQVVRDIVQGMIVLSNRKYDGKIDDHILTIFHSLPPEQMVALLRAVVQKYADRSEDGFHVCNCIDICELGGVVAPASCPGVYSDGQVDGQVDLYETVEDIKAVLQAIRTVPPVRPDPEEALDKARKGTPSQVDIVGLNAKEMIHLKSWLVKAMAVLTVVVLLGLAVLLVFVVGPSVATEQIGTGVELGETILDAVP